MTTKILFNTLLIILIWYVIGWILVFVAYSLHVSQVILTVLIAWAIVPW